MSHCALLLSLFVGLAGATQPALAEQATAPDQSKLDVAASRRTAEAVLEKDRLPALSVAVLHDGRLVWSEAFGWADRKKKIPATTTTKFRIGSLSKALSSAALGLLVQEGTIDLDLPVQTYVPSFPRKPEGTLTTRQAAAHISGLPHYKRGDFVNRRHYDSAIHALDKFKDRALLSAPGEQFNYSSFGWNLVGAVLEGATGSHFLDLMRTRVLDPFSLEHTAPEAPDDTQSQRARAYARVLGLTIGAPRIDNSDAWPSAGFLSTPEDLARFCNAMLEAQLLRQETVDLLWTRQRVKSGQQTEYGLGWQWKRIAGREAVGHGGSHVGATAQMWILPRERLVVALLTNTNSRLLSGLVDSIVEGLLGTSEIEEDKERGAWTYEKVFPTHGNGSVRSPKQ